jgi:hypothetical protein
MVDTSEAEICKRRRAQNVDETRVRLAGVDIAAVNPVEEFPKLRRGHKGCFSLTLPTAAVYR